MRAKREGYDVVVFMADADSNRIRVWREKRDQIVRGFSRVDGVDSAPCVPMSTSESWLLSDAEAWKQLGLFRNDVLPRRPERIWGVRMDPDGDHPHQYFRRVCATAGESDSQDTRVRLATLMNVETVRKVCPASFSTFAEDIMRCGHE